LPDREGLPRDDDFTGWMRRDEDGPAGFHADFRSMTENVVDEVRGAGLKFEKEKLDRRRVDAGKVFATEETGFARGERQLRFQLGEPLGEITKVKAVTEHGDLASVIRELQLQERGLLPAAVVRL